jgi:hypothetical protein
LQIRKLLNAIKSGGSPEVEHYRATPEATEGNGITIKILELKVRRQIAYLAAFQ